MNESTIKASKALQTIAENLDQDIQKNVGERLGFTLIIYTEGRASYIGNVDRKSAIIEINRLLEFWKDDGPDIKAHEVN